MDIHGGNIYKIAEEFGIHEEKIVDFSASINPLGVSDKVKGVIKKELNNLVNYPDPDTKMLRDEIAKHHRIDADTILCGNGSTELIYLIPRAVKPKLVLITSPTFSEYERACTTSCGLRVAGCELKKEDNFKIIPDEFIAAMAGKSSTKEFQSHSSLVTHHASRSFDMAFLCNPNNPTGTLLGREEVLEIADAAKKEKCLLIVDEAFIDFVPDESLIRDVRNNPYLIVLRSMTKFYALTGLRVGYGVFPLHLVEKLKELKEPWTVNNLAQRAAIVALQDSSYTEETMRLMKNEKGFLEESFREIGIEFISSSANYYLLNVDNGSRIVKKMKEKGILVRDCSNFKGLNSSFIRVAVKSHEDNKLLLKELSKLCRA